MICACLITTPGQSATAGRIKPERNAGRYISSEVLGVRGSLPVSGEQFLHYGGNTPCIEIRCGKEVLIFDAGSGLREAGLSLMSEGVSEFDVFFTHTHYDHIIGLPYFKPIYRCSSAVRFWSGHLHGTMSTAEMINEFMRPPWFPVGTGICQASLDTVDFRPGETLSPRKDVSIRTMSLVHPGGCVGYRIEWGGRAVALVYDTEHEPGILDPVLLDFIAGADLMIYDCTYLESEMPTFRGLRTLDRDAWIAARQSRRRHAPRHVPPRSVAHRRRTRRNGTGSPGFLLGRLRRVRPSGHRSIRSATLRQRQAACEAVTSKSPERNSHTLSS